jgi:DNA-binding MarR family transcriptional regulator
MRTIPTRRPSAAIVAQARRVKALMLAFSRRGSLRDPIAGSLEDLGLTPAQVHIVLWLGADGPLTMGDLARRLAVSEKTITGIVDRLERDGLVGRERDPADRRVVHVRLGATGENVHRRVEAAVDAKLEAVLGLLEPADRAALLAILERLDTRLSAGHPAVAEAASPQQPLPGAGHARARRGTKTTHAIRREET